GASGGGVIYTPPYGYPLPGANTSSHLPSSSQPSADTSRSSDYFDFAGKNENAGAMRGPPNASFTLDDKHIETAELAPPVHVVQRGDTLWEICDRYYRSPWEWPRIWSYNPELQNPHWIYPGDQIRMQPSVTPEQAAAAAVKPPALTRFVGRQVRVPPSTIFLREQGYLEDDVNDIWGEVGGSPEDQLLLSQGDNAYLDITPGHDVRVGQELTIFNPLQANLRGDAKGTLVAIVGTARVDKWDPETRVARARLTESLNIIERGAKVGPIGRRFEVVAPVKNEVELWAHVAASLYPHVLYGQNQVVFIDKGQKDGLAAGNRLFVVTRGDEYRKTLPGSSFLATAKVHYENEKPAVIETKGALGHGDDSKYPEEVVGELRVMNVRDHSAACLVVGAEREIEPGQRVVARRGY
ncbi:MAG TPA: LysM domain-containing protein, partial [Polyangiaceae bacterium]|nr:LysM domain-containing protein [Polyangiaceae bacterium]